MKVYYIIPASSKVQAMALWPFVIANTSLRNRGVSMQLLRHEKIHLRQQLELLILPFYIWYIGEWLVRWWICKDPNRAYRTICFEREAYINDEQKNYLKVRKAWSFLKYLK
ncbi:MULTISPECIES: hypothetical protein [Olivibacter]|jgi:hypothetical protein|uniref:DUF4157 domain-containing protein n=3 Tax=Sphingobacteriaceae TaxID=84566 RepID=F4CDT7_SPHS2|nr:MULTISPECIES: hypothetical protein [Olivibacter]MCL4637368.1 hypothetical protein [Olivibacter sp. UJ_SKK_5.1]MDX3915838.1 hypothetical protein [Pseudosphingobacterium sp.]QEL00953.1 hypothetical protein FKG96_09095 [Olivibacter sp. LS-1]